MQVRQEHGVAIFEHEVEGVRRRVFTKPCNPEGDFIPSLEDRRHFEAELMRRSDRGAPFAKIFQTYRGARATLYLGGKPVGVVTSFRALAPTEKPYFGVEALSVEMAKGQWILPGAQVSIADADDSKLVPQDTCLGDCWIDQVNPETSEVERVEGVTYTRKELDFWKELAGLSPKPVEDSLEAFKKAFLVRATPEEIDSQLERMHGRLGLSMAPDGESVAIVPAEQADPHCYFEERTGWAHRVYPELTPEDRARIRGHQVGDLYVDEVERARTDLAFFCELVAGEPLPPYVREILNSDKPAVMFPPIRRRRVNTDGGPLEDPSVGLAYGYKRLLDAVKVRVASGVASGEFKPPAELVANPTAREVRAAGLTSDLAGKLTFGIDLGVKGGTTIILVRRDSDGTVTVLGQETFDR